MTLLTLNVKEVVVGDRLAKVILGRNDDGAFDVSWSETEGTLIESIETLPDGKVVWHYAENEYGVSASDPMDFNEGPVEGILRTEENA